MRWCRTAYGDYGPAARDMNKCHKTDPPKLGSALRVNVFSGLPDQLELPESSFKNFDWTLQPNGSIYE